MEPIPSDLISGREAAQLLGVTQTGLRHNVRRGALRRWRINGRYWYSRFEVITYGERRPVARHRGIPRDIRIWGPRDRPVEHTDLVTVPEAAAILGVAAPTVRGLVYRGLLPAYQADPCKMGSRLRIPRYWVQALAARPAYQAKRRAQERGVADRNPIAPAWDLRNLPAVPARGYSRSCDHDYGDYYSARQAANVLGISPRSVRKLRDNGRLPGGSRTPEMDAYRAALGAGRRSAAPPRVYFRKEDVHALLRDPEYQEHRRRAALAADPKRRAAQIAKDTALAVAVNKRTRPPSVWPDELLGERVSMERILR